MGGESASRRASGVREFEVRDCAHCDFTDVVLNFVQETSREGPD
jgi:hypothetical protein